MNNSATEIIKPRIKQMSAQYVRRFGCTLVGVLGLFCPATPALAVVNANVSVNVNSVLGVVPDTAVGNNLSVYSNQFGNSTQDWTNLNPAMPPLINNSGTQMIRYPGGSYSDLYHFSNHQALGGYAATGTNFGNFVRLLDASSTQGMITVNYGSSFNSYLNAGVPTGMGGQPQEAAAWVAYANGSVGDHTPIGVDAAGIDWHDVDYWASIRSSTMPQGANPTQNYNFLRINHPEPLGIKYWEIGNEVGGNGYNGGYMWEMDLHAPYNSSDTHNDTTGRVGNSLLSPTAYATNLIQFATMMKLVDPTIQIGAGLDGSRTTANQQILTTAGDYIDFGIVHWYVDNGTGSNRDYNLLNATRTAVASQVQAVRNDFATYTSKGPNDYEIHFTEWGYFGSTTSDYVHALFIADAYATGVEQGVKSMDYWEISKTHFLSDSYNPTPGTGFYAAQMYSLQADPGSDILQSTTNNWRAGIHATRLEDGSIALMLVNLNTTTNDNVYTVSINDGNLLTKGAKWLYGATQSTPLQTPLANVGGNFTITVPYRDIMTLIIPKYLSWIGTGSNANWMAVDANGNGTNWKYGITANGNGDPAVFSSDAHGTFTINVNSAVTVGKLTTDGLGGATQWFFNGPGIISLNNNSSTPIIDAAVDTYINTPLSGSNGLNKTGAGELVLAGSINVAGLFDIQEGNLQLNTVGAVSLGDVMGDGALGIGDGTNTTTVSADSVAVGSLNISAGSKLMINAFSGGPLGMTAVPEPSTWALLALAVLALMGTARLRK